MAYSLRRAKRDQDADPRDVVEDAARAAGLSPAAWLERAVEEMEDEDRQRRSSRPARRTPRGRHPNEGAGRRDEAVADVLETAMEQFDAALKRNERRTVREIEALREELATQRPPVREGRASVQDMLADVENAAAGIHEARDAGLRRRSDALIASIEDRVSRVVNHLEATAQQPRHVAPQVQAQQAAEYGYERDRLDQMAAAVNDIAQRLNERPSPASATPHSSDLSSAVNEMLDSLRRMQADTQAERPVRLPDDLGRKLEALPAIQRKLDRLETEVPAGSAELRALRQELAGFKHSMAQAHIQTSRDPGAAAIERQLESLSKRMDIIANHLANSRSRGVRDLRSSQPTRPAAEAILPGVQETVRRAVAELNPAAEQAKVLDAVQRLERRIAGMEQATPDLTPLLDVVQNREPDSRVLSTLQAIQRKVEAMESSPSDLAPLLDIVQRKDSDPKVLNVLQAIERKFEAMERAPHDLAHRLDQLQSMVAGQPQAASGTMPAHLERMLQDMADRIGMIQPDARRSDQQVDALQAEIRALAQRMEGMGHGGGAGIGGDVSAVEQSIQELTLHVERTRREVTAAAERAAREAAEMAAQQATSAAARLFATQPQDSYGAMPSGATADDAGVQRALADLHAAQQESERRTTQTLGAVHDTLHRVIDRLVDMERDIHKAADRPVVMAPVAEAPTVAGHMDSMRVGASPAALAMASIEPATAPNPMSMSQSTPGMNIGASRLEKLGVSLAPAAPAAVKAAGNQSAVLGAIAAARTAVGRLRRPKAEAEAPASFDPPMAPEAPVSAPRSANLDFDMPLEPGSGRPVPGRAPSPSAVEAQDLKTQDLKAQDPKAQFIAAARRAAQAAAAQSAAALSEPMQPARAGKLAAASPPATKAGFGRKHALLLGLAALLVAAGAAMTFMQWKQAPKTAKVAPPAIERTLEAQPSAVATADPIKTDSVTPRQILPQSRNAAAPDQPMPAERLARDSTRIDTGGLAAQATRPQAGSFGADQKIAALPAETSRTLPAPANLSPIDEILFRFEGVRGGEKLKNAARAGDPQAFYELGARFADGRGALREPKTAALWLAKAAESGLAPANYRLGALHREGRGVERDPKLALGYFMAAAEAGHARAMHNAGVLIAEGANGRPDYGTAADWFTKAAELGIKDSQFNLAILHARGLGVPQDLMAAYAWFSAAAAHGDEDAVKKRDEVGARLSADRLAQARAAAAAWKPKAPNAAVNDIEPPAGGWDNEAKSAPAAAPAAKSAKPARS